MNARRYLLLALVGLVVLIVAALYQSAPGYMDADYYYAGGVQLAQGHGFTEPYLWNYLDDPAGLPHPSHAYWMPLASLLAAAGASLFGATSWTAGRMGFILVGAAIPPLTAALAWSLTRRRVLAMVSGLLGVFSAFYLPFIPVTDTFGLYMVLGAVFFLLVLRLTRASSGKDFLFTSLFLGVTAGLMHLARADGLLWMLLALAAALWVRGPAGGWRAKTLSVIVVLGGYLLIMTPWFIRNAAAFGSPLGPGSIRMLWMTSYDQLFAYPADQLTFASWWHSGLTAIIKGRLWALGINLERTLAEQGEVILLPLIAIGLWHLRRERTAQFAGLAWLTTFGIMTFVFPFAGARGGFFHSGAALQPVWWALAPIGLDQAIEWARRKRAWDARQAGLIFRPALVGLAVLLSAAMLAGKVWMPVHSSDTRTLTPLPGVILTPKVDGPWSQENVEYSRVYQFMTGMGVQPTDVVMAANPPGFYLASGLSTIAVPDGGVDTLLEAADRYGATYLVLEAEGMPVGLTDLYAGEETSDRVVSLGSVGAARIFRLSHP